MKTKLFEWKGDTFLEHEKTKQVVLSNPQLLLTFGDKDLIKEPQFYATLKSIFPNSEIALCSTAGEIADHQVNDGGAIVTALEFEKTDIKTAAVQIADFKSSFAAGAALANSLPADGLSYALILSDGALVNGSELVIGLDSVFKSRIPVTGGLAADGIQFQSTGVGLNQVPANGVVLAIGFYGTSLKVGHGSVGGWTVFGAEKTITRSEGNVLYEIDNKNALAFYKDYLGKYAEGLPFSALHFPLAIQVENSKEILVRTILSIDEERQTLTFAGDLPTGCKIRLMRANFDNLILAASEAAGFSTESGVGHHPDFALLISCVGRKLILKDRIEEEVEAVAEKFSQNTVISGFYSNGELSPFNRNNQCQLHNQTMTITTFTEA